MIQTKSFIYIGLLSILIGNTTYSQTAKIKVDLPYLAPCLIINEVPQDYRVPYEKIDLLLFENDSLFSDVSFIEVNNKNFPIPDNCLSKPLFRIELLDHADCVYLLNANKKVLAACYPNESNYEIQWFTDGKNSMLKQWEMVTININYDFDESMENIYISYEEVILERRIDRNGNPEDFELRISYLDKNGDGIIERKISKQN